MWPHVMVHYQIIIQIQTGVCFTAEIHPQFSVRNRPGDIWYFHTQIHYLYFKTWLFIGVMAIFAPSMFLWLCVPLCLCYFLLHIQFRFMFICANKIHVWMVANNNVRAWMQATNIRYLPVINPLDKTVKVTSANVF